MNISGGCQCGAVRYRASALFADGHVCHCRMCQKATGNLFAALVGVKSGGLVWTRGEVALFASSDQVRRGFCSNCGTPLCFHVPAEHNDGVEFWSLMIGSLDDPSAVPLVSEDGPEGRLRQIDQLGAILIKPPTEDCVQQGQETTGNRQHPDFDT